LKGNRLKSSRFLKLNFHIKQVMFTQLMRLVCRVCLVLSQIH